MMLIPVQSLKPGWILATDVKNAHGQLLMKKGVEVVERHVRVLKSWGISEVQVEGDDNKEEESAAEQYDPAILERARSDVLHRMRFNNIGNPVIDELVRICVNRRAHELMANRSTPASPAPAAPPVITSTSPDAGTVEETASKN